MTDEEPAGAPEAPDLDAMQAAVVEGLKATGDAANAVMATLAPHLRLPVMQGLGMACLGTVASQMPSAGSALLGIVAALVDMGQQRGWLPPVPAGHPTVLVFPSDGEAPAADKGSMH